MSRETAGKTQKDDIVVEDDVCQSVCLGGCGMYVDNEIIHFAHSIGTTNLRKSPKKMRMSDTSGYRNNPS